MGKIKFTKLSVFTGIFATAFFGLVFTSGNSGWVKPGVGTFSSFATEGEGDSGDSDSEATTFNPRKNRTNRNALPRFLPNTRPGAHGAPRPRFNDGTNPRPRINSGTNRLPTPERVRLSDPATDAVVSDVNSIVAECISLPVEYRADCLAQNLVEASKVVTTVGYSEVNRQLKSAGQKISREVSRNIDRSKPAIKRNGKTYRAVKKSAVARVNRKATRIVKSTAQKLIRSAGNSAVKKVHFTRIAKAVDNTKVLLRSA